jgi:hypothetical protein
MKFEEVLPALREGKRVKRSSIRGWLKLGVSDNCNFELQYFLTDDWEVEPEPKKPKLLAPALLSDIGHVEMSCYLYASEQEARDTLGDSFISWPAIPNKDGMYEVLSENLP